MINLIYRITHNTPVEYGYEEQDNEEQEVS